MRANLREELATKQKIVKMIFCDENGQMIKDRNIDLNTLGRIMSENGLNINPQIN